VYRCLFPLPLRPFATSGRGLTLQAARPEWDCVTKSTIFCYRSMGFHWPAHKICAHVLHNMMHECARWSDKAFTRYARKPRPLDGEHGHLQIFKDSMMSGNKGTETSPTPARETPSPRPSETSPIPTRETPSPRPSETSGSKRD